MQRRELFAYVAGAAALYPFAAKCQQKLPELGFLHQGSPEPGTLMAAFNAGSTTPASAPIATSGLSTVGPMASTTGYQHWPKTWSAAR
jgi:hypothetical protein